MTPITPATRPFVVTFIQRISNHITVLALAIQINGYEKSPIYNDESLMKIWAIFYHHTIGPSPSFFISSYGGGGNAETPAVTKILI